MAKPTKAKQKGKQGNMDLAEDQDLAEAAPETVAERTEAEATSKSAETSQAGAKGNGGGDGAASSAAGAAGVGAAAAQATAPTMASEGVASDGGRPLDKISAVGHAVWLMTQSPLHKHLFLTDLEWLLMPPIAAGQFRLWRKDNMPLAFASWALLTEEAEQRLIAGRAKLAPAAWTGGDRLWLMDLIAPFGGREEAVKEIKTVVFPGRTIKSLQPGPDGKLQILEM